MRSLLQRLLILLALSATHVMAADWVLVANPQSGIKALSQDEVVNIYLGRYRHLASGLTAEPIDQAADTPIRARFYRHLVNKNVAEINAYWSRLTFSGKTKPPRVATSSEQALQLVAHTQGALAYIERSQVDARVVVVFEWPE